MKHFSQLWSGLAIIVMVAAIALVGGEPAESPEGFTRWPPAYEEGGTINVSPPWTARWHTGLNVAGEVPVVVFYEDGSGNHVTADYDYVGKGEYQIELTDATLVFRVFPYEGPGGVKFDLYYRVETK